MSFSFSTLHPSLQRGIADLGFTEPTPIQVSAIPPALAGRDVLGCAMTGSGKTAAFLLPIMERLLANPRSGVTRALVLAPTRELAAQIVEQFRDLAKHTKLKAATVFGGAGMQPQERAFRQGVDVIVACPGRLLDHFQYPYAKLESLEVLVLDEADRMLDMGFLPDIRRVLKHIPRAEHTMLFSATLPPPIVELSRSLMRNPVRIGIERVAAPATGVTQAVFPVRQDLKPALLVELLRRNEVGNVLVFTRTKHRADRLAKSLIREGVACDRIHGNRSQGQRTKALSDFKRGSIRVLVATDIAARGIDVEALSHVVNFDVPGQPEDYIHRVGRTARAGAVGEAFTFASDQELSELHAIERAVGKKLPRRLVEGFDYKAVRAVNLEIPLGERLATMRAQRAKGRERAATKSAHPPRGAQPRTGATGARPGGGDTRPARPAAAPSRGGTRPGMRQGW
ncbi:MAG TPA: DEAD/DEAH box helicase [Thermoanaerobaculia bacterium]|nr:DEAD/DEAH box helicase [Thermoanaerobaculia bacterium]